MQPMRILVLCWLGWALPAAAELPADSLYQLRTELLTQEGTRQPLGMYRGHPTLISMFYGSCAASCPMLITSLQVYERQLPAAARTRMRVLLISFDPEHDTAPRLGVLAHEHRTDALRWTLAVAATDEARKIAALLGVQYRPLPEGGYDHSLLITLLDPDGRRLASTTKLVGDAQFETRLAAAADSAPR